MTREEEDVYQILKTRGDETGLMASDVYRFCRQAGLPWTGTEVVLVLRALVSQGVLERSFFGQSGWVGYRIKLLVWEECEIPL